MTPAPDREPGQLPADDVFSPANMVKESVQSATDSYRMLLSDAAEKRSHLEQEAKARYRAAVVDGNKQDAAADLFDELAAIHVEHAATLARASVEYEQAVAAAHAVRGILVAGEGSPHLYTARGEVADARDVYFRDLDAALAGYRLRLRQARDAYFAVPPGQRGEGDAARRRGAVDAALADVFSAVSDAFSAYTARQQAIRLRHETATGATPPVAT